MEKPRYYFKDTYHHLYNRGINRQEIFFDKKDYLFFLKRLREYKEKYRISILCYCLMPNHFHLFVKQLTDEYSIGKFIGDLINSYTKATNKRYNRNGFLFESRTKSKWIENNEYFIWLCKYILINPVRSNIVKQPDHWEYSCAKDYYGLRNGILIDKEEILSQFHAIEDFRLFIEENKDKFDYTIFS
jgi:putative transposase